MACFTLILLCSAALSAQTTFHAGVAAGMQTYASSSESPRILSAAELMLLRRSAGIQVAVEYADLPEGALIVTHPNLVYRHQFGDDGFVLFGAGPTFASVGQSGHRTTWNAALELGYRWSGGEAFARVRQYDYELERFREGEAGPTGPAFYLGTRFRIGR